MNFSSPSCDLNITSCNWRISVSGPFLGCISQEDGGFRTVTDVVMEDTKANNVISFFGIYFLSEIY